MSARELKDIDLKELSYVGKPAHRKAKILFFKARGEGRGAGGAAQGDGGAKYCVCSECGYSEKHEKSGEGKSTPCTKIKCPECGTLMKGSDTKMLKKAKKINIVIDSDGTVGGTKIVVNKDELNDLRDFNFSFYSGSGDDISRAVSCSYSKFVEAEDGFQRSETFYLSKGESIMESKVQEQLQEYFGEDEKIDFEKAEENDVIVKSLEIVNEYREEFPDDLKKAVGVIAKQASMYAPVEKKDEKEGVEKAGAKYSKDTLSKLKALVAAAKALEDSLPSEAEKSDSSNDDDNDEKGQLKKTIEELTKSVEQLEKEKDTEAKDELTKTLKELNKRLEAVEKGTGVKKSEDGQEDGDNDNESSAEDPFPSIKL